jgi:DnaK suppressor protein
LPQAVQAARILKFAMNIQYFKQRLQDKERELLSDIARLEGEARDSGEAEVRDSIDDATTSQGASESLQEETLASQTLIQVQDALKRIEDGTYGKCNACGRQIEAARLEAVPWAAYCLEDQEKQDRAAHVPQGGSTL